MLKTKNASLFDQFKYAIVGEAQKGKDLVIGYNEDTNAFVYSFYQKGHKMREFVHKCKVKWMKKLLRKWFPDEVTYVTEYVQIAYPALCGIMDTFLANKNIIIDIQFDAKKDVYSYCLAWRKGNMPGRRAFVCKKGLTYVDVHMGAVKEAWSLFNGILEI
jgi:hypothetical protein